MTALNQERRDIIPGVVPTACRHQCLIYQGAPSRNLPGLVPLIKQKLQENYRCMHLNSPAMIAGFRSYLAAADVDVISHVAGASLVLSSDQRHLSQGGFDVEAMMDTLKDAVHQALTDGYKGLFATGDMTWEFGPARDFSRLLEYEWRLDEFIRQNPGLSGICLYHTDTLPYDAVRRGRMTHESFFVNETLSRMNPEYIPPGFRQAGEMLR